MVCKSRGFYFIGTSFMIVTPQPVISTLSGEISSPSSSSSPSPGGSHLQSASDSTGSHESPNNSAPMSAHSDEEFQAFFDAAGVFPTDQETNRFEEIM